MNEKQKKVKRYRQKSSFIQKIYKILLDIIRNLLYNANYKMHYCAI